MFRVVLTSSLVIVPYSEDDYVQTAHDAEHILVAGNAEPKKVIMLYDDKFYTNKTEELWT